MTAPIQSIDELEIQICNLTGTNGTVPALLSWLGIQGSTLKVLTTPAIQAELAGNDQLTPLGKQVLQVILQIGQLEEESV